MKCVIIACDSLLTMTLSDASNNKNTTRGSSIQQLSPVVIILKVTANFCIQFLWKYKQRKSSGKQQQRVNSRKISDLSN